MMKNPMDPAVFRRRFLKLLAGTPLLALGASHGSIAEELLGSLLQEIPLAQSPEQALSVFDFEPVAKRNIPPAHWGYMATGVDDEMTLRANRAGFSRFQIRPRRLVDAIKLDTSTELFGTRWKTPILLCPVGSQRAFHAEGELAVARAAKAKDHLQILSTVSSTSVEDVSTARGMPVWYQLYPTDSWPITQALVRRAEAAGCPVIVFTVDVLGGRNTETDKRLARIDTRTCSNCHQTGGPRNAAGNSIINKPMFKGLDLSRVRNLNAPILTWEHVKRLKDGMKGKLVLKGIETREDAQLCLENGVDGIIVSNHGGRAEESGRGAIECLSEVVDAVQGRVPVIIDGGFRRGTDIFKALALGAKAVGIGRPYIWGLGAFGQPGVERVLDLLRAEFELIMRQAGATSIARLNRSFILERS